MHSRKSILKHSRVYNRKRKRLIGKAVAIIFAVVVILFSLSFVSGISATTIHTVQVVGADSTDAPLIEKVARGELEGKYFHFISRANSLFFPKQKIENDILNTFPSVESVKVTRADVHTLLVKITEREPFAFWCTGKVTSLPPQNAKCYLLDKDGLIFAKASDPLPPNLLTYSGAVEKQTDPIGEHFLTSDDLHNLSAFLEFLGALHLTPLFIVADSSGELEVYIEGGHKLLLRTGMPYDTALQNLESLFNDSTLDWGEKGIPASLEYIDLRFDNKVFYK
ncbi:MAG: hypothetical protein PHV93_03575 [Candidatus Pacebacteria bacterium]|nr:hypothetical protein [Candidatus Paceibacterota bacterium]